MYHRSYGAFVRCLKTERGSSRAAVGVEPSLTTVDANRHAPFWQADSCTWANVQKRAPQDYESEGRRFESCRAREGKPRERGALTTYPPGFGRTRTGRPGCDESGNRLFRGPMSVRRELSSPRGSGLFSLLATSRIAACNSTGRRKRRGFGFCAGRRAREASIRGRFGRTFPATLPQSSASAPRSPYG